MSNIFDMIHNCRICNGIKMTDVIDLGDQVITSRFPDFGSFDTPKTPMTLCLCSDCGLLQLRHKIVQNELYEHEYGYRSGISNTMREHLKDYQQDILSKIQLKKDDIIVDIGSNDSTMLQFYDNIYKRIGIDPTGKQFFEYYGDVELIPDYFTKDNFQNVYGDKKCKIISSISMFYDLPQPVQFAKDIYDILDDDGIWTCEQSYLLSMLNQNSFDTICHEHLEYYSLHQIKLIADMANLKIIDISFNSCNGGSFRIYFAKKNSNKYYECTELIEKILKEELDKDILNTSVYSDFMHNCNKEMRKLRNFINIVNDNQEDISLYGASTKGNCLLQYANITDFDIQYAVERNPKKIGKMTSTGIEIIGEDTMRENPPAYLLVLPWHFRSEIIEREHEYLKNGGQLIFPLPNFEIYSLKPKVLVTGCDGHIASYFKETHLDTINYYGIGHNDPKIPEKGMIKTYFNLHDFYTLEEIILTIKPDIIVHLAGVSSSIKAFHEPTNTAITNGTVAIKICEIIHTNNLSTKLFNASSSEIYKGHVNYVVQENDNNMFHNHPYSIAKIASHSMVDFYRNTYNLNFCNGTIFTTESPRKSPDFLLNKVSNHAKNWKKTDKPLILGNLDSLRNILHAKDTANAIHHIIQQEKGDNYLICNFKSYKMLDIVIDIYNECGIKLFISENVLYDSITNEPVVVIGNTLKETDNQIVNIQGYPEKLLTLGWKPEYNLELLIRDIVKKI